MHHLPHHPTPTCVALLWLWQLCVAFRNSTNMCDYHWHFFYHTLISLLDFVSANRFKGLQRWKLRIVMFNPKTFVFFFGAETFTNIYIDWMSSSPKNSSNSFGFCLQLCVCVITCCKKDDFSEWFGRNAVYDPRTTTAPSSTTVLPGNSQSWTYPPKVVLVKASFQGFRFREGWAWQCEKLVMNPVTLKISQDIIYLNIIIYFSYLHWSSKLYYIYCNH